MNRPALLALALVLTARVAAASEEADARHTIETASGSLSALRILDADAHLYEYPTQGMIIRLGSQFIPVKLDSGKMDDLSRVNFALGMGFEPFKVLILADLLSLSDSFLPHSGSITPITRQNVLLAVPITPVPWFSLTPAFRYGGLRKNDSSGGNSFDETKSWLVRARVAGLRAQVAKGDSAVNVVSSLSPFELLGTFSGDLGDRLLSLVGNPEALFEHYEAGSVPYAFDRTTPAENDYGLRWETPPWLRDGFFHAEGLVGAGSAGTRWRRAELGYRQTIKLFDHRLFGANTTNNCVTAMCLSWVAAFVPFLGVWSPGATLMTVDARAFALNMEDKPRVGFTGAVRFNFVSNNKRLNGDGKREMNELALSYEGEDSEHVNFYLEARVARNDFYSLQGLPVEDLTTFGLWFGSENLVTDPDTAGLARAQRNALNEALDGSPFYGPDPKRAKQLEGVKQELSHPSGGGLQHQAPAPAPAPAPTPVITPPPAAPAPAAEPAPAPAPAPAAEPAPAPASAP